MSRRDLLKYAGAGAGALGLSAFLQACGVSGTAQNQKSPTNSTPAVDQLKQIYGNGKPAGQLNFANWPDYIDVNSKGDSPTLLQFTKDPLVQDTLPRLEEGGGVLRGEFRPGGTER